MFKRILLAVDGSEHSLRATVYSIELAEKFGGVVDAVYVVDKDTAWKDAVKAKKKTELESEWEKRLDFVEVQLREAKTIFGTHTLYGDPAQQISEFARERGCDCIVIGSRGLHPIQSVFLGSVSSQVVKLADCPVLIVK